MKKLKTYTIFMEPSSYTLDLVTNVHDKLEIKYCFMEKSTKAKTNFKKKLTYLSEKGFITRMLFLSKIHKNNDLIIINAYNRIEFLFIFFLNLLSFNKKYIAIESDTQYKTEENSIKFKIKRIYLNFIFKNKYVLGFSGGNFSHKKLFLNYGMDEKRIFLAPMMVNNEKFYNEKKEKSEKLNFLYVGRIIPLKNLVFLIESFIKVFKDKTDVVLNIVGTGSQLDDLIKEFDKHQNINFKGAKYDEELIEEYFKSNILILPSFDEPWGLVVNEALSAGLVVLSSDKVGANEDLIENKKTGFIFELPKENDLSEKMLYLYNNRDIVEEYAKNAENLMKNHWNYELYVNNLKKAMQYVEN